MSTYPLKTKTIVTIGCILVQYTLGGLVLSKKIPYQGLALTTYLQVWIQREPYNQIF